MQRQPSTPRPQWEKELEEIGFTFHGLDGGYWTEDACYELMPREVDELESATAELHERCCEAAGRIITGRRLDQLRIPTVWHQEIIESWEEDEPYLYGRMDLVYDGTGPPKLLEYNADTPTALLEAAVAQWHWLEAARPGADQFNSLHERLIERWKTVRSALSTDELHLTGLSESEEDTQTLAYLTDVAQQAGFRTVPVAIDRIGWDPRLREFVDESDHRIEALFKLYPWEWMINEPFAPHLLEASLYLIEPAWKMLLSGKGLLPILWEMYPDHPYLLRASWRPIDDAVMVRKPARGREGANVTILDDDFVVAQTTGTYDDGQWVYQEFQPPGRFDGR